MSGGTSVLFQTVIFVPLQYREILIHDIAAVALLVHVYTSWRRLPSALVPQRDPCLFLPLFPTCQVFTTLAVLSCYLIFSLKLPSLRHRRTHPHTHTHAPSVFRLSISNRLTSLCQEMLLDFLAAPWSSRACPTRIFWRLLASSHLTPPLKICACFTRHPSAE